ncbi:hypothetical protein CA3LBN_001189 [Candidozyma haemuli]|uniref:Dolichyl-diphosphooligosaccharide-protein glycosyltransferase subunit OST5 n=1 Tax=Candidozyma haemuli TaxID=45357 RepID=A0ABX8I185_9ASCO|nr:hypothetical protein CA3LBN_001189 [[Candida] haemuloni]
MDVQKTLDNIVSFTDLDALFKRGSSEIFPSALQQQQTVITVVLVLLAFVSLALAFLNRSSPAKYFSSAAVASVSIGLGSIYVANFFGVYI